MHLPASVSPAETENPPITGVRCHVGGHHHAWLSSFLGPEVIVLSIRSQKTLSLKYRIRLISMNPDQEAHPRTKIKPEPETR